MDTKTLHIKQPKYQTIAEDIATKIVEKSTLLAKKYMHVHRSLHNMVYRLKRLVVRLRYCKI